MNIARRYLICLSALLAAATQAGGGAHLGSRAHHLASLRSALGVEKPGSDKCGLPTIAAAMHQERTNERLQPFLEALRTRPVRQKSIIRGNFRIHYDTTGVHVPAMLDQNHIPIPGTADEFADSAGSIIIAVASAQIDLLGYEGPPPDQGAGGGNEYDIYIENLGNLYGLTTPETPLDSKPDGGRHTSFITIDNDFVFVSPDSNRGLPALRVTLAHEFHHAIQLGSYGFWTNEVYYYELTSVWLEDVLYTEVNDYIQYLWSNQGHFARPHVSFTSNEPIMYSRGIWGQFVSKRFGTDAMRTSWQEIRNHRPLTAIDRSLQAHGSTFRRAFAEWTIWNGNAGPLADTLRYYPEGRTFRSVTRTDVQFNPPSLNVSDSLPFLSARYVGVRAGSLSSIPLMAANLNHDAALAGNSAMFPYTYLLADRPIDGTYRRLASNVYGKFVSADPTNWFTGGFEGSVVQGTVFPNPFLADGRSLVSLAVNYPYAVQGEVSIFTSSLDLVTRIHGPAVPDALIDQYVFTWNGRSDKGELATSGVYVFVIELPGETVTGKFVLVRR